MNAVIMSFDPNEKQSVICERNQSLSRDSLGLAMRIHYVPAYAKFAHEFPTLFHKPCATYL